METDRLAEALQRFVNTEDWEEARRTVEENPELLSDEAQELLNENIADYREADRGDIADYLEDHRRILQRSREIGIERAFQEAEDRARTALAARQRQLAALRPKNPTPEQAVVWELLDAESPEEINRVLADHPELAHSEEAIKYLDGLLEQAKSQGYAEAERFLGEYHELLRTLYELPPLLRTLQEFMNVPDWSESRELLKNHPELMTDQALETMDDLIREAERQGDQPAMRALRTYRQVLQRSREVGPDQAVDEIVRAEKAH